MQLSQRWLNQEIKQVTMPSTTLIGLITNCGTYNSWNEEYKYLIIVTTNGEFGLYSYTWFINSQNLILRLQERKYQKFILQ